MELELLKYNPSTKKQDREYLTIASYRPVCHNTSLLLVKDGSTEVNEGEEASNNFLEIFKVQFITNSVCFKTFEYFLLILMNMFKG